MPVRSRPAVQGRREVLEQAAGVLGAVLIAPKPAFADGAVSPATVQRARGIYGSRIASLKGAVENGDFDAILEEKNAFELFNSGAFSLRSATAKEQKKTSVAATKDILEACAAKDKSKLKSVAESVPAITCIPRLVSTLHAQVCLHHIHEECCHRYLAGRCGNWPRVPKRVRLEGPHPKGFHLPTLNFLPNGRVRRPRSFLVYHMSRPNNPSSGHILFTSYSRQRAGVFLVVFKNSRTRAQCVFGF